MKAYILLLMILVAGCAQTVEDDKLDVIVSIPPQKEFIEAVGADYVAVDVLIPEGRSPATYDPRPSDLVNIEKADIYFRIGHIPFEKAYTERIKGLNPEMIIVDTSEDVELRTIGGNIDPHIWLSPLAVKKQVDSIEDGLSEIDPENSETYRANAESYKDRLDTLHEELNDTLSGISGNKIMVFHPSWGYFADEYGLEQIAIQQEGKEPTAKDLQDLIKTAQANNISVIFVQEQFNVDIARGIAEEIDGTVVSIDPLSEDYISSMRKIAETLTGEIG